MRRRPWMRTASRVDGNSKAIVEHLEANGCSVIDLRWPCDLLCGLAGVTFLVEVKDPRTRYGKRGLNKAQKEFLLGWRGGPVYTVTTVESVTGVVEAVRHEGRTRRAA